MIRSFVFFDLETTGFIKNNTMPKITEMSLIAVSESNIRSGVDSLPRVLHKLILPIHPETCVSERIKSLTGLSNNNIRDTESFNSEIYTLVTNFIKRLKAPTCFVAHNGNQFDYPIFLWELQNIDKVLSEDILSIDMLQLVRAFFAQGNINRTYNNTEEITILFDDGCDVLLSNALDSTMNSSSTSCESETTLDSQCRNAKSGNKQESCSRKKLNLTFSKPANFKLPTIYEHLFHERPENAHSAEGDCLSMIRCAIKFGDFFLEWAERNAVPLISHSK